MKPGVLLAGLTLLFVLSLGCLGFFLFFVDPTYLSFSGFILFYASGFLLVWSAFMMLAYLLFGRSKRKFPEGAARRAAFLAILATAGIFLRHMNIFSVYLIVALVAALAYAEYRLIKRR